MEDLTLEQKIALCSGKNQWETKAFPDQGIPSVKMSDGPNGLRKQEGNCDMLGLQESKPSTAYPTASIAACSFDRKLLKEYGEALGTETRMEQVSMILGPGVNIKRNPLCGRNFEYFSEDPYLSGQLGQSYVEGVQESGTGACIKHFACNNQEYYRMTSDSLLDERTLREIYLSPFENIVKKAGPRAVMAAYNKINGTYCCSNKRLLTDILRDEWGYEGMVVTDWTAVEDRTDSFRAGCDLVMPGGNGYGEKKALQAVRSGELDAKYVEESAGRVKEFAVEGEKLLPKYFKYEESAAPEKTHPIAGEGLFKSASGESLEGKTDFHSISRHIAEHSAVLLKNQGQVLPLENLENICFIGQMAENFRYQGYGSSKINPVRVDQIRSLKPDAAYCPGYREDGTTDDALIKEAVNLAAKYHKAVIFAGLPGIYESEGYDRPDMKLPEGHSRLIEEVSKANSNTIVVLLSGSAVEVPWIDHVKGLLYMGLSGEAGAGAALRLLTGEVNPSGKLAETWPLHYEDTVNATYYANSLRNSQENVQENAGETVQETAQETAQRNAQYREGIYVGYRYYEKAGKGVRFPFGFGLSYTEFIYKNLKVDLRTMTARISIRNTGSLPGEETALLFVSCLDDNYRPVRELRGFEKVYLLPGEEKTITIEIDPRAFQIWQQGWVTINGNYIIQVTGNPQKIGSEACYFIKGEKQVNPLELSNWYLKPQGSPTEEDFKTIYSGEIPQIKLKPYTINSNVGDMLQDVWLLRFIYKIFEKRQARQFGRNTADYKSMMIMAKECPLRSLQNNLLLKGNIARVLANMGNKASKKE